MATKQRPCRYGSACRNPTCSFSHDVASAPSSFPAHTSSYSAPLSSSAQPCRYGSSCKRFDCRFSHPTSLNSSYQQPAQQLPPHMLSPSMTPCRFGLHCTAPNCRFFHDDDEEFSPEEEERIDEILDMIEQEQRARDGLGGDEEDDKNIDEIFAYKKNQQQAAQGNSSSAEDFSLPDDADEEYEAMMQQQHQRPYYVDEYPFQRSSSSNESTSKPNFLAHFSHFPYLFIHSSPLPYPSLIISLINLLSLLYPSHPFPLSYHLFFSPSSASTFPSSSFVPSPFASFSTPLLSLLL
eukprot:Phypoly_transcript_11394.p1 GENE.Phypoly_transcript_11394~~Phypoly_transcript_11394.p1  ORF type:complete len:294 (+),score=61.86 Phypoly_transcript_11394:79-960(+)